MHTCLKSEALTIIMNLYMILGSLYTALATRDKLIQIEIQL